MNEDHDVAPSTRARAEIGHRHNGASGISRTGRVIFRSASEVLPEPTDTAHATVIPRAEAERLAAQIAMYKERDST